MRKEVGFPGALLAPVFLCSMLCACQSTQPGSAPPQPAQVNTTATPPAAPGDRTATQPPRASSQSVTAPASQPASQAADEVKSTAKKEADEAKQEAKKARERERRLGRLQESMGVAELNLEKAKLARDHAELQFQDSVQKAEADLEVARTKLSNLLERTGPNRTARAELGLQYADDGVTEAREELDQLEQMYSEEQFADQTKEIVIERARRRLERAERDLELRREEYKILVDVTLPQEQRDLELSIAQQERSLEQLRRSHETSQIDQNVALRNAEAEVVRIENELIDVREEIEEAQSKKAEPTSMPSGPT